MKDEIKEILDELSDKDVYVNNETLITLDEAKILLNYITNLQESEAYYYGQYKGYKLINKKAIEYIKSFGSDSDRKNYLLYFNEIINGTLNILQGENNTQENLYKYTPEKGFRLVGDEDVKDKR